MSAANILRTLAATLSAAALLGAAPPGARGVRTIRVEKWENGFIRREEHRLNGELDGDVRGWYADGSPAYRYHFVSGVSEGLQEQWYPSGQPLTRFHHHAGHEAGQQQMWNADGTIRSNYVIKGGRRFGLLGTMGCSGRDSTASREAR